MADSATRTKVRQVFARVLKAALPTHPQLAKAAGVTYSAFRAYLRQDRTPSPEVLVKVAKALRKQGGKLVELADELERAAQTPSGRTQ